MDWPWKCLLPCPFWRISRARPVAAFSLFFYLGQGTAVEWTQRSELHFQLISFDATEDLSSSPQ